MSVYHILNLKKEPETSRIGEKWTDEEENKLIALIASGKSIKEVAREHQRTIKGIESRKRHIAVNMLNSKSVEEICNLLQITEEDIKVYQSRRVKNQEINTNQENIIEILNDIRRRLEIIESKIG